MDARTNIHIGDKLKLTLDMNKSHFFDPQTEQVLVIDPNADIKPSKMSKKKLNKLLFYTL